MPSLLTPDFGLLFWMLLSFTIVFIILAKYGFPVIIKMVEDRKRYIDESLKSAREANERLANIKAEGEDIIKKAHEQQAKILREANATSADIIKEAKDKAVAEGHKMLDDAKQQISAEKERAMQDIRQQVVALSVDVAEKILRQNLNSDSKQAEHIGRLLDEVDAN